MKGPTKDATPCAFIVSVENGLPFPTDIDRIHVNIFVFRIRWNDTAVGRHPRQHGSGAKCDGMRVGYIFRCACRELVVRSGLRMDGAAHTREGGLPCSGDAKLRAASCSSLRSTRRVAQSAVGMMRQ